MKSTTPLSQPQNSSLRQARIGATVSASHRGPASEPSLRDFLMTLREANELGCHLGLQFRNAKERSRYEKLRSRKMLARRAELAADDWEKRCFGRSE